MLVGIGALFGGAMAVYDPYGVTFGMPVDVLRNGPFNNFLIPGLFLFAVIGLGQLASYWLVRRKAKYHAYASGASGCILAGWILIQCYILQSIHFLHTTFFAIGVAEGAIALYMLAKLKLFPFTGAFRKHMEG